MSPYETTSVPVGRSKASVEDLLSKRGVTDTRFTTTATLFAVEFNWALRERCEIRKDGYCSAHKSWAKKHAPIKGVLGVRIVAPWSAEEKEQRRIARVLYWHLKSKLEIVESGVVTFEQEFMPHLTLGRGRTVYDEFRPMLEAAVIEGRDLSVVMDELTNQTMQRALPEGRPAVATYAETQLSHTNVKENETNG